MFKSRRRRDKRTFALFSSLSSCRGDQPAWLDVWGRGEKERKEKKEKRPQSMRPLFVLVGTSFYPLTTHTHTQKHTGWLKWCVTVCLCVWLPLPLSVCDWLYLRQGPFCFKPENGSKTEAGPVIGLLRPCLAWEKPSLARQCQANSCFQPTRWSEFRIGPKHPPTTLNTLLHPLL